MAIAACSPNPRANSRSASVNTRSAAVSTKVSMPRGASPNLRGTVRQVFSLGRSMDSRTSSGSAGSETVSTTTSPASSNALFEG